MKLKISFNFLVSNIEKIMLINITTTYLITLNGRFLKIQNEPNSACCMKHLVMRSAEKVLYRCSSQWLKHWPVLNKSLVLGELIHWLIGSLVGESNMER